MADNKNNDELSPLKRAFLALDEANRRIEELERRAHEPIAIVGMGCRFPGGADSPDRYWELLKEGRDVVTDMPADRWDVDACFDPDPSAPDKMSVRRGAFLDKVDEFDAGFFGISPREARAMDPQQRLLLEVTWQALEDAGIPADSLHGTPTGVFVGMCKCDYGNMHRDSADPSRYGIYSTAGHAYSMASGRISYCLGLQGPSTTIDTACSSSMVALHVACQSLLLDESRLAIVGGVNLILSPENTISFSKAEMMSPDGMCRTFDADANGFVQGEGCAVVVLKRLSAAVADGDDVLAVIRASAVNQDGPSSGLTAPNGAAQQAVIREALAKAGVDAGSVSYVEAHGTGTSLGDPIEVRALASVYGAGHSAERPLQVGSVKTNMGHLEGAAGLASLLKVVLSLRHGAIPPHLHFRKPSPHIDWDRIPVAVPTTLRAWDGAGGERIAGVSSFGFSGTNVHAIVADAPARAADARAANRPLDIFVLSAKSAEALDDLAGRYGAWLARGVSHGDLASLCRAAATGRSHHAARLAVRAGSVEELGTVLAEPSIPAAGLARGLRKKKASPRVAFLFTGQGAQYVGMGRELYESHTSFRAAIDRCAGLLDDQLDMPLRSILFPAAGDVERARACLERTACVQPVLFAFEYALASRWMSWGIKPSAVAGHSVGEYAAACIAGLLDLEDALRLITARGRLMQAQPAGGRMTAVLAPEAEVDAALADVEGAISIAAINGPRNTVISGDGQIVSRVAAAFAERGIECRDLHVSHAFHSPLMKPMLTAYATELDATQFSRPTISLVSNVTGRSAGFDELANTDYWLRHIEQPVRFARSVETLAERGCEIFIEIGPHPVLIAMAQTVADSDTVAWVPSIRRPGSDEPATEWESMQKALADVYVAGGDVDWPAVYEHQASSCHSLPTYAFQRSRHWFDDSVPRRLARTSGAHALLGDRIDTPLHSTIFEQYLAAGDLEFVHDHQVHGQTVMPATAYVELALAAAAECGLGDTGITDFSLMAAMIFPESGHLQVQTVLDDTGGTRSLRVFSRPDGGTWTLHCEATLNPAEVLARSRAADDMSDARDIAHDDFYAGLHARGLQFGPRLRGVSSVAVFERSAIGHVEAPDGVSREAGRFRFHPAMLDACLQVVAAAVPGYDAADDAAPIFMPVAMDRCLLRAGPWTELRSTATVTGVADDGMSMIARVEAADPDGNVVAVIEGIHLRRVLAAELAPSRDGDCFYQVEWREDASGIARSRPQLPAARALCAHAGDVFDQHAERYRLPDYQRNLEILETICCGFILRALAELGFRPEPGEPVRPDVLADKLGIVAEQRRLFRRFLQILAERGDLSANGADFVVARCLETPDAASEIAALAGQWPDGEAEVALVTRCGPALADVLRGKADPLELLFPAGDTEAGAGIYTTSPLARVFNASVAAIVEQAVLGLPAGTTLRVLEIGAGTGGTTRYIADAVDMSRVDYLFTDIGALFVSRAEARFAEFPSMRYQVLDIERDPGEQGLHDETFDLVIAANIVHATRDLQRTLGHVRKLLAPSGAFVMTEVVGRRNWIDVTFGMTEGWWHFTDTALRPDYPLLPVADWRELLESSGFTAVETVPADSAKGGENAVLVSEAGAAVAGVAADAQRWLVFSDRRGAADTLYSNPRSPFAHGERVWVAGTADMPADATLVDPHNADDFTRLLANAGEIDGILYLWPLDDTPLEARGGDQAPAALSARSLLYLAQALARAGRTLPAGLWVVTSGASSTGYDETAVARAQTLSPGLARVLRQEHPEFACRQVDIDPEADDFCAAALESLVRTPGDEPEVAIRGAATFVPRLVHVPDLAAFMADDDSCLRLASRERGMLENLVYNKTNRLVAGPGQIGIRVHSTGLNFRDVLNALGNYAGGDVPFGSECAGCVDEVGPGVTGYAVGDRVIAIAEHAFSDRVVANAKLVAPLPAGMSYAVGSCLPIAYVTAFYCLHRIARLQKGESVLIHAGAGGVGMAAIHLARAAGATVYATAGSRRKRQFLREMGVERVLDSRSLGFAGELRGATANKGVDVVINSLAGDFIAATLSVLGKGGRFIEIGRSAIWSSDRMAAERPDVSYHAVDLSTDMLEPDDEMRDTLSSIVADVASGKLATPPVRSFTRDETVAAFRYMAQARHIGKIAIEAPGAAPAGIARGSRWLVTGAFGGLGLLVSRWLAAQGAAQLVMLGRSEPGDDARRTLDELVEQGVDIRVETCDVSDRQGMEQVFGRIAANGRGLNGILHCAGRVDDAPILQQDWDGFESVMAAKVHGTLLLDELSRPFDLDHFVTFSTIASVLGSPGQANHCAANSFLDALATWRHQQNLPAVNINWGIWSEVGAAVDYDVAARATEQGFALIHPGDGLRYLQRLLRCRRNQTMVQAVDWQRYRAAGAPLANPRLLAELVDAGATAAEPRKPAGSVAAGLKALPVENREQALLRLVRGEVASVLGLASAAHLPDDLPLKDAGLDSLLAVELRSAIGAQLDMRLPATLMFDYPTISGVTGFLAGTLFGGESADEVLPAAATDGGADVDDLFSSIENLSEEEARVQFEKRIQDA